MTILTVTSKGQVTLRKDVLKHLGVEPGERIAVDLLPDGKAAISAARMRSDFGGFIGCLKTKGQRPVSLDEIKTAIADGWASIGKDHR